MRDLWGHLFGGMEWYETCGGSGGPGGATEAMWVVALCAAAPGRFILFTNCIPCEDEFTARE